MQKNNQVHQLSFSGLHINAKFLKDVRNYDIQNRTVAINPNLAEAYVDEPLRNTIEPLSSTILKNTRIEKAASLILLEVVQAQDLGSIIFEPGWDLLSNIIGDVPPNPNELPYPKNTPLWRSAQDSLGEIKIDPYTMTGQRSTPQAPETFEIKVNLWFAPAQTNCFIHNKHDFIEIHSQICGYGRMQKFKAQDPDTLYKDIFMSPGYTTSVPFCQVEEHHKFRYPWHQYYADTDCIWLAIEYHPQAVSEKV